MKNKNIDTLITDNLDLWTSAIENRSASGRGSSKKINLYGIKKLRELILELAVRGKLVEQDPNDEPASVLLERIAKEKEKLIKEGKFKKQKKLPEIGEDEKPFELPEGWEWIRLGELTNYGISDKVEPKDVKSDTWVLELEDVEKETSKLLRKIKYKDRNFKSSKNKFFKNDVIYSKLRPYLDKVIVADGNGVCTTEMIPLRAYCCIYPNFLRLLMKTPYFIKYANESTHGMNLPRLGTDKARLALLPIISEEEQNRIVTKVDSLMSLCDQLEQQTETSITAHQTLVETLLDTLTQSQDAEELAQNWNRISDHFDTLFTTEQSIDSLKQTILQLAVMGKLVEQDPNDEPASVLLEKIAKEKEKLVKEGKIKKQKLLPEIGEGEKPFELPVGWEWCRLIDISSKITDGDHKTPPRIQEGYRLLSAKNVRDGFLDYENCDHISKEFYLKSRERCLPEIGDLLIVSVGGTIGRSSLIEKDSTFALVRSVALIKPLNYNSKYLKLTMDSKLLQNTIHEKKRGGAQPCLYLSEISNFPFPLAPLEEQNRIVRKVNDLMSLCDQLKEKLSSVKDVQLCLADSVVEKVVG